MLANSRRPLLRLVALVVAVISTRQARADDVILSPIVAGQPCAALVIIQGAEVPAEAYEPLMRVIQSTSRNLSLWIGAPDFPLSTPEPLVIDGGIRGILSAMESKGLNSSQCSIFVGGHSLGGIMVQDWADKQQPFSALEDSRGFRRDDATLSLSGQVLMGSYLQRKWRNQTEPYPIETFTVGGELDGLSRITRMAEAYWHQILHPKAQDLGRFPMVVLPGVTHFQFASGKAPVTVQDRDFHPEVTYEEAHATIATVISAYLYETMRKMLEQRGLEASALRNDLESMVKDTGSLLQPLIESMEMEGFYHFLPPCNSNPVTAKCQKGSAWSAWAQSRFMSGETQVPGLNVTAVDSFHPVYQINPIHLPHLLNNCTAPSACRLSVTTVTQNIYATLDELDTAFFPVAATTMRVKMKSRQAIYEAAGMTKVDFNETDGGNICQEINRASLAYARQKAAPHTLARFDKLGEPLIMGTDLGPYNAGPLWIWNDLHYEQKKPGPTTTVQSPMMKTPNDYWEPTARGFHYCKLLSPARAMEWLYVDGLRAHDSLSNATLYD